MDYEAQYDKIYRYCYFKLNNAAVAEDITQEAFLRFLENSTYQEDGKGLNYLYTIARNLCIDEYRRKVCEELPEDLADEQAEEGMLENLSMRLALKKLSPMERELVLLRYVNEVPVKVICELQECSRFSLNRKLKQVLKKLREYLSEEPEIAGGQSRTVRQNGKEGWKNRKPETDKENGSVSCRKGEWV